MHFNSIPALAAALSFGASGVLSSVIPKPRGVESRAGFLAEEAAFCIEDFCATKGDEKQPTTQCGPVVLTVTHLGAPPSLEECVSQFSYLIAQDTESVTSRTEHALYKISTENSSEPAVNEKRAKTKPKDTKPKDTKLKNTKPKGKKTKGKKPKGTKPKGKKPKGTKPKDTKPKDTKPKDTKPKDTKPKDTKPKACPLPKKGKNGKPIQRRCADEFYEKTDLIAGKVTHWKFNTMKYTHTYDSNEKVERVLDNMNLLGQLDVVKVVEGGLTVVGEVKIDEAADTDEEDWKFYTGTDVKDFTKKGGNYLLMNGGFFQHTEERDYKFAPVGEGTRIETNEGTVEKFEFDYPVPEAYAEYYTSIEGLKNTKVFSGPDLQKDIPGIDRDEGIWKFKKSGNPPGSLNHASQPNERIALVRFGATSYSITYTCKEAEPGKRTCGLSTNKFKDLINTFFSSMGETGKSIDTSDQAVCLDGGPSVTMIWQKDGEEPRTISLGAHDDKTPTAQGHPRRVSNLIKIKAE